MDIKEAVKHLREGKRIRRNSFKEVEYFCQQNNYPVEDSIFMMFVEDESAMVSQFSLDDLEADDWEIV